MTIGLDQLASELATMAGKCERLMVAIAGPPGSGKSTLAEKLLSRLETLSCASAILPMDGYHLDNAILKQRGLLERKGAPETFDAAGFVRMVKHLAQCAGREDVFVPVFDRQRDLAIAAASIVSKDTRIVLCEGNYLLLEDEPWSHLQPIWGHSIYLNLGMNTLEHRLINRWIDHGLSPEDAEVRARNNDLANAALVKRKSTGATMQFT